MAPGKSSNKRAGFRGLSNNPLIYFGIASIFLFSSIYNSSGSPESIINKSRAAFLDSFSAKTVASSVENLFSSQADAIQLETPDLTIIQDNTLCAVATPCVVSSKVLGDVFGGNNQNQKEVIDYIVQPGDTLQSIATSYNISATTLALANSISTTSTIKVGQSLVVLPIDGIFHVVKSGDTISAIAQKYKAQADNIISYNNLANQDDIYVGDILIVPGGTMPKVSTPVINNQIPMASNYFIFPTQGKISQGLHYYNAVDVANKCGTPIYAAAAGVVQRAVGNGGWNSGMGNHITILHGNGTVTYYGHLQSLLVKPGDKVYTGQNIGLMGGQPGTPGAGKSTGCHLHFQVIGGKNPLSIYLLGSKISY